MSLLVSPVIDEAHPEATLRDYPNWSVLEQTLYELCCKYPDHANHAGTNAKLWLIGRGFATGIERQIRSNGGQGSTMMTLCDHFHANHNKIDRIIHELATICEPLDENKLRTIASAHGRFCRLLSPVVRKRLWPRSFAAKYLHFHCSAVPIYDSYSAANLTGRCRWNPSYNAYSKPKDADGTYHWFLLRFWQMYLAARKIKPNVSVRLLDMYLLW